MSSNIRTGGTPMFSGKPIDFSTWVSRFKAYAIRKKMIDILVLAEKKRKGEAVILVEEEEEDNNIKFYALMIECLDDKNTRRIENEDMSGIMAWKVLHDHYKVKDRFTLLELQSEFNKRTLQPNEDPTDFIMDLEDVGKRMKEIHHVITDEMMITKVLSSLTPEYETFKTTYIDIEDLALLKQKLKSQYLHVIKPKSSTNSVNEVVNYTNSRGRGRGKYNNNNRNNNNNHNNNNNNTNNKNKDNNNARGRGRGRGNNYGTRQNSNKPSFKKGIYCNNCNKEGHMYRDCFAKGGGKEGQYPKKEESNQTYDQYDGSFYVDEIKQCIDEDNQRTSDEASNANDETFNTCSNRHVIKLYIDSACTRHMVKDEVLFTNIENDNRNIGTAFGGGKSSGIGKNRFKSLDISRNITASDVLYTPNIPKNLLCTAMLMDKGNNPDLFNMTLTLKQGDVIPIKREGNLFYIEVLPIEEEVNIAIEDLKLWHKRFGHANNEMLKKLPERVKGMALKNVNEKCKCETCILTKSKKKKFSKFKEKENKPLDCVVTCQEESISNQSEETNMCLDLLIATPDIPWYFQ